MVQAGALPALGGAVGRWLADHPEHDRLVLDQFEELFGAAISASERRRLLDQLFGLADQQPQVTVLRVMRNECYTQLADAAPRILEQPLVNVPPTLRRDELAAIIVAKPAVQAGKLGAQEVAVALESGDAVEALRSADRVEVDDLPIPERRAHFLDTARAQVLRRDDGAVVAVLLEAERHLPLDARYNDGQVSFGDYCDAQVRCSRQPPVTCHERSAQFSGERDVQGV